MRRRSPLAWAGVYTLLCLAPLVVALFSRLDRPSRPFLLEASTALAILAFAAILLQFSLVPRISRRIALPADALMLLHREMGIMALALALAHPLLLLGQGMSPAAFIPFLGGWSTTSGAIALWALLVVVLAAVTRRRLPASYERWHTAHILGSWLVVGITLLHGFAIDRPGRAGALEFTLLAYAAAFLVLAVRYRVARPLRLRRCPWTVVSNRDLGGRTRLVRVRPNGHDGFPFLPGQFAWVATGRSPFAIEQHPISIASSAERASDGGLEFAVKMLGDWSSNVVPALQPGHVVWVDGPYGALTPDAKARGRLILIGGGIGIAPLRSIILTQADRGDTRPVHVFFAAADRARAVFADEFDAVAARMPLTMTYVFEQPAGDWRGERGYLNAEILARHLEPLHSDDRYLVCGPGPMMDAVERSLERLGVPGSSIETERFDMV